MKKIFSLVLCFIMGSFVLAGCSDDNDPFTQKDYTADASQIEQINIDVRDREIEVSLSEDEQIHIEYYENSKEYYNISVEENVLTVTGASNKDWTDYIGSKPSAEVRKILLQVPNELLENLTLSTTNEDITLSALTVSGSINVSSNGGNIAFGKLDVGNALTLNVKNGNISGSVAGGYDDFAIQTEVKKGESNLPESKEGGDKVLK